MQVDVNLERVKVELLPCPFCKSDDIHVGVAASCTYHVRCNNCGARTRPVDITEGLPYVGPKSQDFDNDYLIVCSKIAVNLWNRRGE